MVLEYFHRSTMWQLISSIDPLVAFFFGIAVFVMVASYIATKFYIPDSEWRRRYSHPRSHKTVH